jgi:butyryl-CoA dehydrogenase
MPEHVLDRWTLTDEQEQLKDSVRRLAVDRYAGRSVEWDTSFTPFPTQERRFLADLGLVGITLPEAYGGGGRPLLDALVVIEELAKACPLAAWPTFEASTGPARVIDLFGTEEQKQRLLPPIAAGERTLAVSISEPDAGTAATDLSTKATLDGDEVVISGSKRWCSGAGQAEQYLVYVRLGREPGGKGIGAVVVDRDSPGLRFGPQEKLMGHHGVGSADMFFDEVRAPADNLIVGKGGFADLFKAFSIERLGNATNSLAIGQACLDRSSAYVRERRQFGREIAEFQLVQAAVADMLMDVQASRLLIYAAAARAGCRFPRPLDASVAKCFANEMAKRVADRAMQIHGGYGYATDYGVERMLRDAHGWALAGGTGNVQRTRIAAEYLGRKFNQRA